MLQRHTVDTTVAAPADRFGMWLDLIARTAAPLRIRSDHTADFAARADVIELGPIQLVSYRYPSLHAVRTRKPFQCSDPEVYSLALTTTGRSGISQHGRSSRFDTADFTFYDCFQPHEVSHVGRHAGRERATTVAVVIPHAALPLPVDRLAPLFAGRFSGTEGLGALLADYLVRITRHPEQYQAADADRLGTVGLDLVTTMLGRYLVSEDDVPAEVRRRALLTRVRAYIRENLGDPGLDPRAIADAHHVSVRSLHRLFEAEETTVAEYVRASRLERCRRDLADPTLRDRPVQALALRWGFRDKAHFSRAFRAAYGTTPQAYRREQARIVNERASTVNSARDGAAHTGDGPVTGSTGGTAHR
ncbi:helix-turn-helix domain-containing protein [Micromonospora olivasterospora]|uniref:Transcriptional regulator, AraC family n=1 Tax=Micromonospora olivasterospora TaxID=1880 RepID=A0A562IEG2_MICOL|nr:helix-turn-helix domain-containing protein [Micromonospora olivasterospora]TWH69397.1 transcriptional regulator, AraC family [Micromonospora olivasterospora]